MSGPGHQQKTAMLTQKLLTWNFPNEVIQLSWSHGEDQIMDSDEVLGQEDEFTDLSGEELSGREDNMVDDL